jgi:hypothetical protein
MGKAPAFLPSSHIRFLVLFTSHIYPRHTHVLVFHQFTGAWKEQGVRISLAGRPRALDNIILERVWRRCEIGSPISVSMEEEGKSKDVFQS